MKRIIRHENGETKVQSINNEPTRTDQTQKDMCNINNIMKKYGKNINNVPPLQRGMTGDFSELPSYIDALNTINTARNSFDALPAVARKRFNNDPQEMIEFLKDPSNTNEAIKLGLAIKLPQKKSETKIPKTETPKKSSDNKSNAE